MLIASLQDDRHSDAICCYIFVGINSLKLHSFWNRNNVSIVLGFQLDSLHSSLYLFYFDLTSQFGHMFTTEFAMSFQVWFLPIPHMEDCLEKGEKSSSAYHSCF
jgi:hypothetical protein